MRTHMDLFSGIGGFALAAEMVWPDIQHVFCDNDAFSQAILKKHWPAAPIYGDIRTLTADSYRDGLTGAHEIHTAETREQAQRLAARRCACSVYLLTGGFPCQPFSQAGRRRGTEDDRYLWPEMLRVIREFHPQWVIGENVGGLVTWNDGMVLEQVQSDLENEGYEVQAFVIPAAAVNAPPRRDRVWIVAHCNGGESNTRNVAEPVGAPHTQSRPNNANSHAHNTSSIGYREEGKIQARGNRAVGAGINAANTEGERLRGRSGIRTRRKDSKKGRNETWGENQRCDWNANWLEVATRLCALDDGLPNGLARPRGWRNAALKGAGNAIVPQVAAEIMRAIKYADE